jgi:hypothetical protein
MEIGHLKFQWPFYLVRIFTLLSNLGTFWSQILSFKKKKTPKVEKQFDFIFKKSPFFFTIASQKRQMFKFFIAYFFHSQIWAKSAHGRLPSQLHHKNERKTLHPIIGEKVRLIFLFIKNINLK